MARDTASNGNLDKLYLKFFKYVVVGLMTLALLAIVVLIPMAALQYLQTPTPATPAKAPPARAVDLEDFKKFLIEEERRRLEQEKSGGASATTKQAVSGPLVPSLYAEQSIQLQRCSEDFRQLAQQETDTASEKELSDRRETQRASIERLASEQFRGPDWPAAMVTFVCGVLRNPAIAKLKQDKLVGAVVGPAISFHARAWASIEKEKFDFTRKEEARVQGEEMAETLRIAAAKVRAMFMLSTAGGAFLFFMVMALYLIFAKIEDNLAMINQTILHRTVPSVDAS